MLDMKKLKFWGKPKCYYCYCPDVKYHRHYKTNDGKEKTDYYCGICYHLRYLQGK